MATFQTVWIQQHSSAFDDWVDINPLTFAGTIGATLLRGFSSILGGTTFSATISNPSECFIDTTEEAADLPNVGDPPFPPVYPYFFSTDYIYGRDHLSLNLKMVRGDTYRFSFAIILNGEPVDLTGGTVRMTAKWKVSDPDIDAVFQLSTDTSGLTITDALQGTVDAVIASTLTSPLPARKVELPYDIQYVSVSGDINTVLTGTLTIVPDVTLTT